MTKPITEMTVLLASLINDAEDADLPLPFSVTASGFDLTASFHDPADVAQWAARFNLADDSEDRAGQTWATGTVFGVEVRCVAVGKRAEVPA